jgi:hypothetical protein
MNTIPTTTQMENLLIEKLCAIELQADKMASAEGTAPVAHENDKRRQPSRQPTPRSLQQVKGLKN